MNSGDAILRGMLDPRRQPVQLGFWRAVTVAGANRLAYFETRRTPEGEASFGVTVYREPIPPVLRLTKQGALKLLTHMTDASTWTGWSTVGHEAALDAVRALAGEREEADDIVTITAVEVPDAVKDEPLVEDGFNDA